MAKRFNIRMAGVGGQGVVTGSHIHRYGGDQRGRRKHHCSVLRIRRSGWLRSKVMCGFPMSQFINW